MPGGQIAYPFDISLSLKIRIQEVDEDSALRKLQTLLPPHAKITRVRIKDVNASPKPAKTKLR